MYLVLSFDGRYHKEYTDKEKLQHLGAGATVSTYLLEV